MRSGDFTVGESGYDIAMKRLAVLLFSIAACSTVAGEGEAQRIAPAVTLAARPLPLSAVRLTGGPLKHAQDLDARYLLTLEPDRMLAFYRQRAGLTLKAEPYGGWDGDGRNLTGHIAGHYLSAVSLMRAATGDERFKERADYIVRELKEVQDKQGDGFAGALAKVKEAFAEVSKGNIRSANFDLNGLWSPWYTLHKTFAGLRDAYRYTSNATALAIEAEFAKWAERVVAPLDQAQMQKMLGTEFGGMNEVLADLYADTGDKRWLDLSYKFEHRAVLDPLKRRDDPLDGLHGNTQIPKLIGSLSRYVYTGDASDRVAAEFFWDRVVHHHTFATGGHGKDEYFREPDHLGNIVDGRTAETCNVYNMLKLTRGLFAIRPEIEYAEFQERALFNHILGSIDPAEGATCYMVPVGRGVRREYQDMSRSFTCCVGSGMESHALHGYGIYYESGDRLWVNLYAPSTLDWRAAGVRLDVETTFPEGESATLTLTANAPRSFTLALRRPSWAGTGFTVSVNGERVEELPAPPSYFELKREWKTGDSVKVTLPKSLRLEATDNPRRAAILWGPLVLAGDLGPAPQRTREIPASGSPAADGAKPQVPSLVTSGRPVTEWLKPDANKPGSFRSDGVGRAADVEFVPFYRLHRRTYAAYWDLMTPAEYEAMVAERGAERARQQALDAATVGLVQPGGPEAEKAANQQGEETSILRGDDGRAGRRAAKWFSYDVAVTGGEPSALVVTYNSDNRRPRSFEVLVDEQRLGEQRMEQSSVARFFDVKYLLPPELVRGKQKLTVRFQATGGNEVALVFGIRLIK
jgi:uncharacterized protein